MGKFKIGDIITSDDPYSKAFRLRGTVIGRHVKFDDIVGVEFDSPIEDGHACEWNMKEAQGKQGYCWFFHEDSLRLIETKKIKKRQWSGHSNQAHK